MDTYLYIRSGLLDQARAMRLRLVEGRLDEGQRLGGGRCFV